MPQGERRTADLDFFDYTYDGTVTNNYLSGGIGQLMDGVEGQTNFRVDPDNIGHKGYEWIGWKNDTTDVRRSPIQIVFEFDRIRNFSWVRFHVNNQFSKDVRVFRKAVVYFSIGPAGSMYQKTPVVFDFVRDEVIDNSRLVSIPIPHRVALTMRVDLFFDAKWMMISEVRFESGE
jgi:discoidin domain receptor family protein 2